MSAYLDLPAMNAALKELYDGQTVENLVFMDNPALALIKKMTSFGGKYMPVPIVTGVSQGRSATFSNAQGNQSAAQIQSFLLTRASDYSLASIDNQTMLASRTDKMTFLEGAKVVIDGAITAATNSLATAMFRSGTGSVGQIGTITSGVITMSNTADAVNFEINQVLQANATDGGTPRAALGYVTAVDYIAGTITVSATAMGGSAGSPSGWTANDYLLVQGDNNAKVVGFSGWLPQSVSASDSFFGVNRSQTTRLKGVYYSGAAQSIEEAIIDHGSQISRLGGRPSHFITNYASWSALEKSLSSKVVYIDHKMADIAFRGIQLMGSKGPIQIFADRSCQPFTGWMLSLQNWCLNSLGDAPQILKYGDGLEMLRVYNADAGEVRVGYYAQISCNAPGWSGQTLLSA